MSATAQRLDECLSIRDGELFIEDCQALELARRFGTPLHVVSEDQLRRNARRLESAFASRWPGELLLLPSIKANSSLALRRILTDEGTGCDVFGPGELEAALRTGTEPERISLNGPMKDEALLERADPRGRSDHAGQSGRARAHGRGGRPAREDGADPPALSPRPRRLRRAL